MRVLIDPGHGPKSKNGGALGYLEHEGMWKVSSYLKAILEKEGVTVSMTRKFNDDPTLYERGTMAQGYDIFISEHSNARADTAYRGASCYHSLQRSSAEWAGALSKASAEVMGTPDRGAKTRHASYSTQVDFYGVIRHAAGTDCKHIFLAESGYHSNLQDERWLMNDDNLQKLAGAHAKVIFQILGIEKEVGKMVDKLDRAPHPWEVSGLEWLVEMGYLDEGRHLPHEVMTKGLFGTLMKRMRFEVGGQVVIGDGKVSHAKR